MRSKRHDLISGVNFEGKEELGRITSANESESNLVVYSVE